MYRYDDIRHVHLEPSTRCNAACPMCTRNMRGVTSPGLRLTSLSIQDVERIFPHDFAARLQGVDFCGAYGDPVLARDLPSIVKYFREASPSAKLTVFTNGGPHGPAWWGGLAGALGSPGRVIFGIDGIGETNGIYRRNVRFDSVLANAKAFIAAGGEAQWDFLVFRHNEHQVEDARKLSEEMGFVTFQPKKTGRFVRSAMEYVPELDGQPETGYFPIFDSGGAPVGRLEPPKQSEWRNDSATTLGQFRSSADGVQRMLDTTPIDCRVKTARSIYVGAQGWVFPCCQSYTAATLPAVYGRPAQTDTQLEDLIESLGGFERLNAFRVGLRGAVESDLIASIEESWSKDRISDGRLKVCARVCGTELGTFEKQFASADLVPGRTSGSLSLVSSRRKIRGI
jgi:hypothetical protein